MERSKRTTTAAIILTVCFALFFIGQWAPYYQNSDGESVSLAGYIWLPTEHEDVTLALEGQVEGYTINGILSSGIFLPLLAIVLAILALKYQGNPLIYAGSAIWSLWGLIGFRVNQALRLGSGSTQILYMVMFCAVLVISVAELLQVRKAQKTDEELVGAKA